MRELSSCLQADFSTTWGCHITCLILCAHTLPNCGQPLFDPLLPDNHPFWVAFTIKLNDIVAVISLRGKANFQFVAESPFISNACAKVENLWKGLHIVIFQHSIIAFIGKFLHVITTLLIAFIHLIQAHLVSFRLHLPKWDMH